MIPESLVPIVKPGPSPHRQQRGPAGLLQQGQVVDELLHVQGVAAVLVHELEEGQEVVGIDADLRVSYWSLLAVV